MSGTEGMAWVLHGMTVIATQMLYGQKTVAAEGRTIAGQRVHFRSAMGLKATQFLEASSRTFVLLRRSWDGVDTGHWREQSKACQLALMLTGC